MDGDEQPFEQTSLSGRRKRAPPVEAVVTVEDNLHTHRWVSSGVEWLMTSIDFMP